MEMNEQVLDAENWKLEAEAVINDIKSHVRSAKLSSNLQSTNKHIFFNLTTIEGAPFCVELSGDGFRVVGKEFDKRDINTEEYFETPYSLLSKISPGYSNSFGNALMQKLQQLQDNQ